MFSVKLVIFFFVVEAMISFKSKQEIEKNLPEVVSMDRIKAYVYNLAWGDAAQRGENLPDSAIIFIEEFRRISSIKNDYNDLSAAYKARYYYYRNRDNFPETYLSAYNYVEAARWSEDSTTIIDATYCIGRLLFINGSYYESLDYFLQMAEMNLSTNKRANLYYTLAQIYSVMGTHDRALVNQYYDLAEAETQKFDFTETSIKGHILFGRANLYNPFSDAELFDFKGLRSSQVDSLNKATAMMEESLNYTQSCMQYVALSLYYAMMSEMESSNQHIQKALEVVSDNTEWIGAINFVRAIVNYRDGKVDEAVSIATSAMETSLSKNDLSNAQKNMTVLYNIYRKTGEASKSLYYLERANKLNDSILKREKQEQAITSQIKFDTKVKEEQLLTAEEKNRIQVLYIQITGMISLILLILIGVIFLYYKLKQKTYLGFYRQIKEQDRITNDLKELTEQHERLLQSVSQKNNTFFIKDTASDNPASPSDLQHQMLVVRLRDYVLKDNNYAKPDIDREDLIIALSTNRTTLSEAVRTVTNKTLMEYINFLRLEEAKQMLDKHPELTVEAIAENCGFNLRTFHRLFSENYQISPAKYRKIQIRTEN